MKRPKLSAMPQRAITPHDRTTTLVTGHFKQGADYCAWRPTGTDDWLLIYTLGGLGRFGYSGGEIIARPGDLVLLRPGTFHDYGVESTLKKWDLLWVHFHPRPECIDWLSWPEEAPGLLRIRLASGPMRDGIVARFFEAHHAATGADRRRESVAMNALEDVLLRCDALNPVGEQARLDPRVREAMDCLCLRLKEKLSLQDAADAAGLSVSRLAHLFRQQTGVTPQQFLETQRLTRARQLLELTSLGIKEIASLTGFASPFYFPLRFKKQTGVSPRQWRQRGRKETRPSARVTSSDHHTARRDRVFRDKPGQKFADRP
jgi:AraC family transcriptional regulator of arabinose operon